MNKSTNTPDTLSYQAPTAAPSFIRATGMVGYCPWRHLGHLEGVTLAWHDGGHMGETDFEAGTISLRRGLTAAERRTVLAHELAHVELGPGVGGYGANTAREMVEEYVVDLTAALRLFPAWVLEDIPELVEKHGVEAVCDLHLVDRDMVDDAVNVVRRARKWNPA
jgi:hypothetical protein